MPIKYVELFVEEEMRLHHPRARVEVAGVWPLAQRMPFHHRAELGTDHIDELRLIKPLRRPDLELIHLGVGHHPFVQGEICAFLRHVIAAVLAAEVTER
ncbi:MAG: hypothetical protein U1E57_09485 [Paenacidovorax caeni]